MSQDTTTIATESFLSVHLKISSIGTSVSDDNITAEVTHDKSMAEGEGRFTKSIFKDALMPYRKLVGKARKYLRDMTFEGVGPERLIALAEREKFVAKMEAYRVAIQKEADAFIANYDTHLEEERLSKKGLAFRSSDYPLKHALAGKFGFELTLYPVASPSQFAGKFDAATEAQLKSKYEGQLAAAVSKSQDKVLKTLLGLIQETAATLADPDAPLVDSENKKGPVAKLAEYLERVPALNVTGDKVIQSLVDQCKGTLVLATKTLKDSSMVRSKTSSEASAILQQFQSGGGMGRKLSA